MIMGLSKDVKHAPAPCYRARSGHNDTIAQLQGWGGCRAVSHLLIMRRQTCCALADSAWSLRSHHCSLRPLHRPTFRRGLSPFLVRKRQGTVSSTPSETAPTLPSIITARWLSMAEMKATATIGLPTPTEPWFRF